MKWKFSKFLYFSKGAGKSILFSTLHGSVFVLNKNETDVVEKFWNATFGKKEMELPLFDFFVQQKIVVEEAFDETDYIIAEHNKALKNKDYLHLTLFVTDECNFRCRYCFVNKENRNVMTPDVFERIYRYVEKHLDTSYGLSISWFGGEPLERFEYILEYSKRLKDLCIRKNKMYDSFLVTNGYSLDLKKAKQLYEAGNKGFQITFDGDEEQHDSVRRCLNQPTFSKIFKNIRYLRYLPYDDVSVVIRCNESDVALDSFIEKYEKFFSEDKRFSLSVKPIVDYDSDSVRILMTTYSGKIGYLAQYAEKYHSLDSFVRDKFLPRRRWCGTLSPHSLVISPDGKVYTCDSTVNNERYLLGKIDKDGEYIENPEFDMNYFNQILDEKCMSCKRLPLCFGSCQRIYHKTQMHACALNDKDIDDFLKYLLLQEEQVKK